MHILPADASKRHRSDVTYPCSSPHVSIVSFTKVPLVNEISGNGYLNQHHWPRTAQAYMRVFELDAEEVYQLVEALGRSGL